MVIDSYTSSYLPFNVWSSTYQTNLKTLCAAQKMSVSTLFATAQQPHLRDIFINPRILPLDKLINKQEGILVSKVICWKSFSIMEMLGIKLIWEINGLLRIQYHYMQPHILNSFFTTVPSILGMAYQMTYAANHHSVLSTINYNSCIYPKHSFPIYIVSPIIKGIILAIISWFLYFQLLLILIEDIVRSIFKKKLRWKLNA